MDNIKAYLTEWAVVYIRNMDVTRRKLKSISDDTKGYDLVAEYADKKRYFLAIPFFSSIDEFKNAFADEHITIVSFNTKQNINFLIKNWKKLSQHPKISLIFVNPFSMGDKKWVLYPWTHNRIADPSSLSTGIRSMAEGIGFTDEKEIRKAIV